MQIQIVSNVNLHFGGSERQICTRCTFLFLSCKEVEKECQEKKREKEQLNIERK